MNETDIRKMAADVLAGIAPEADLSTVGDDEDLREALDLDSMDFLNFLIGISERSGRKIPEADAPRLQTMRGLIGYLQGANANA
ncbi:acyl carrier protein [Piscinibacter sakaiensis]|uniref:acyl carrier protein n=1 Tax=Piscinibacter sakaiensis TaxID=1547922 RepID=UPI003AAAE4C9